MNPENEKLLVPGDTIEKHLLPLTQTPQAKVSSGHSRDYESSNTKTSTKNNIPPMSNLIIAMALKNNFCS